ncbi:TolC family protein [Prolixibacteraceae bacterium JC049]|nr:TolC family protein [Prolixibacteraceae bacterium JC049]
MRELSILFIGFMLISHGGWAQKWDLGKCMNFAIQHNLQVKNQQLRTAISKEDYQQSYRNMLPGVSASSSANQRFGKSVDPTTNEFINKKFFSANFGLSSSVNLFSGFQQWNAISYYKLAKEQAFEQERKVRIELAFDVMSAYYDVVYYHGMQQIAAEQVEASEVNVKRNKKLVELGLKAQTDLLEMEARLAKEQLQRVQMENKFQQSVLKLKKLMNYPVKDELDVVLTVNDPALLEDNYSADLVFDKTQLFYPLLKSADLNVKSAKKSLAIERGKLYPSLSFSGGYGSNFSDSRKKKISDDVYKTVSFGTQLDDNMSKSLSLSLSIPIFSRWGKRSAIKKSKLRLQIAKNEQDDTQRQIYLQVTQDVQQLESYKKEFRQSAINVEAQELAFKVAEKKLSQGLINIVEYNTVKIDMANAKATALRVKTQYAIKKQTIDLYCGTSLFGINY